MVADGANQILLFQILIELGKQLQPGSGDGRFCKPTSVAVLPSGEFFVADGYCNSRIIKYNAAGGKIAEWGERPSKQKGLQPLNHLRFHTNRRT
jgi:NHL repeat